MRYLVNAALNALELRPPREAAVGSASYPPTVPTGCNLVVPSLRFRDILLGGRATRTESVSARATVEKDRYRDFLLLSLHRPAAPVRCAVEI